MDLDRLKIDEQEKRPPTGKTLVIVSSIVCLVCGFIGGVAVGSRRPGDGSTVDTVVVQASTGSEAGRAFSAGGWIEVASPEYPIIVSSRISQRLEQLLVRPGNTVTSSQTVALMYAEDIQAKLRVAEARAREQEEKLRLARANYERSRKLDKGAISEEDLDRDLSSLNTAAASHAAALAEADLARKELSYCAVTAPAHAAPLKVLNVLHNPGDWLESGKSAAIVSLYDPANMQTRVDVSQTNIRFVKAGGKVKVRTETNPEREYAGTVLRIDPLAELSKNTVTVRIRMDEPDGMLFPEMVAHVSFLASGAAGEKSAELAVPADAVVGSGAASHVFIYENGCARKRDVKVSRVAGKTAFIADGLASGQRVIVTNAGKLADGREVKTK